MVDFHTTQILTGHGCFGEYLHKFKRLAYPKFVDFLFHRDDAEHAIFYCDRWWSLRRALEVDMGLQFEPDTMVDVMLQSKEKWNTIQKFLNKILSRREEEERKRQQEEAL
ncbi:Reverse transcriptase domain-containing protein [Aphis craccivora]|uniref:Reverse transcriptase domain-containing protein n=1 Tax=Aphis craccivora TaxID=307492 RepID=A0A6G0XAJ6_APHCR|nr:Reverse transcriptase domain-containing protein [Aphis craccivora]